MTATFQALRARAERIAGAYLQTRFYPPLPAEYAPLLVEVADLTVDGDYEAEVDIPHTLDGGPLPKGAYTGTHKDGSTGHIATAYALGRALRVERFISEWLDEIEPEEDLA